MNLTIYSKDGCPFCDKIKKVAEYLKEKKSFNVTVYSLNENFTKEQFYQEFGEGSTFPQVILNEKHTGGCIDTINYLQENNLL
jgi:glutaredoxin